MATQEELIATLTYIRDKASEGDKSLEWAGNNARKGIHLITVFGARHSCINTQILYILNNIGSWKGTKAEKIRVLLKAHTGIRQGEPR